jgi:hypothetical protein
VGTAVSPQIEGNSRVGDNGVEARSVRLVVDDDVFAVTDEPDWRSLWLSFPVYGREKPDQVVVEEIGESGLVSDDGSNLADGVEQFVPAIDTPPTSHYDAVEVGVPLLFNTVLASYTGRVRTVTRNERRARLAVRHGVARKATSPEDVVESLVGVHSSDPSSVYLAMWARIPGFVVHDLERALYESRSLVRHWAMRRTLWVVSRSLLPSFIASSTDPIGTTERRRTIKIIEDGGVSDDGDAWLEEVLPKTMDVIRASGEIFTRRLTKMVPELSDKVTFTNKAGEVVSTTGMASRALVQLGMESRVVRSRPAGSWVSGQYSWADIEDWLDGPLARPDAEDASARVVAAYLRSFGPVTETDVRWWTGWSAVQARTALATVGAAVVDLGEDGLGYLHPEDVDEVPCSGPWVAMLPSLDSTTMGWKERDWYLGDHAPSLFDRNGNAGPTLWVDGKVVGGWAQRKDGEIVYELLEEVGAESRGDVEARCASLSEWLDGVVVTPRFRSPQDRRLAP